MESDSAWAGFGSEYIEAIRGEYPKSTIWTWGIESDKVRYFEMTLIVDECRKKAYIRTNYIVDLREYFIIHTVCSTPALTVLNIDRLVFLLASFRSVFLTLRLDHPTYSDKD